VSGGRGPDAEGERGLRKTSDDGVGVIRDSLRTPEIQRTVCWAPTGRRGGGISLRKKERRSEEGKATDTPIRGKRTKHAAIGNSKRLLEAVCGGGSANWRKYKGLEGRGPFYKGSIFQKRGVSTPEKSFLFTKERRKRYDGTSQEEEWVD